MMNLMLSKNESKPNWIVSIDMRFFFKSIIEKYNQDRENMNLAILAFSTKRTERMKKTKAVLV